MKNIKKCLIIGAFLGVLIIPNISSADTVADLQAQIQALLAQISQLQAQLAQIQGQPATWCHDFSVNLSIGSSGNEVESLRTVLEKEGFKIETENFNESMASSVSGFQEKYKDEILTPLGLKYGTGYAGASTRKKLNSLYGCGVIPTPTPTPTPIPANKPPVISGVSGPTTLNVGQTGTWQIKASDPEQGVLSYQVLWGDEAAGVSAQLAQPLTYYSQTATFTHSYSKAGIYNPTFTVTDNKGLSAKTSVSVNVGAVVVQSSITVLSPNGGEVWEVGKNYEIKFSVSSSMTSGSLVKIDLADNTTGIHQTLATVDTPTAGTNTWLWPIPTTIAPGQYRIVVQCGINSVCYLDSSDAPFSIAAAGVGIDFTVENLNIIPADAGKESVLSFNIMNRGNKTYYWTEHGYAYQNMFTVGYLSATNGYDTTERLISDGCRTSVNLVPGAGCSVKLGLTFNTAGTKSIPVTADYANMVPETNENNNTATIQTVILTTAPSITVLSPNGGEQWQIGSTHTILWTPYGYNPDVNPANQVSAYLEKYVNGNFITAGKIVPAGKASIHWDGEINTSGNYAEPGDYYIRVINNTTGATDRSNAPFKLVARGTLKADLKVNGSDGPIIIPPGGVEYKVSWTSNTETCTIYNPTGESFEGLPPSGEKLMKFMPNYEGYEKYIYLSCVSKSPVEGSASDIVKILPSVAPSFSVLSPNGGETVIWSSPYNIRLQYTSDIYKVSIALYKNDTFFKWIVTDSPLGTGGTHEHTCLLSNIISSADLGNNIFKIYILGYKTGGGTVEDKSDAPFSIAAAGTEASLTISKATSFMAQNVAVGVSGQPLGGFTVEAKGEPIIGSKMTFRFSIGVIEGATSNITNVTNVFLYDENNNVVAGPVDVSSAGLATFIDTVTIPIGKKTFTLKGKVANFTNNQTITVSTTPSSDWIIVGSITGSSLSALPVFLVSSNAVTVKAPALSFSVVPLLSQTSVAGAQQFTFASYKLDATQSSDDLKIVTIPLALKTVSGVATSLTSCKFYDGSTALNTGGNVINPSTSSDFGVTFTFDFPFVIQKGTTKIINLKCDINGSTSNNSSYQWRIAESGKGWSVIGAASGLYVVPSIVGAYNNELVTIFSAGLFSVSLDPSSPIAKTVAAGSTNVTATVLKFSAVNESIALQQLALQFDGSNLSAITKYTIWDGATKVGEGLFIGTSKTSTAVFTSQIIIPKNGYKILTIKVDLAQVGTGQPAQIGNMVAINYDGNNYQNTKGVGQSSGTIINSSTKIDTVASSIILVAGTSGGGGVGQSPQLNQMANSLESAKAILDQLLESLKNL